MTRLRRRSIHIGGNLLDLSDHPKLAMMRKLRTGINALKEKDAEGAINAFSEILEEDPTNATAHVGLGRGYARNNEHQKAVEHFDIALEQDGDLANALRYSAGSLEALGEIDTAKERLEKAIALDPSQTRLQLRIARMLEKADRADEAKEYLVSATQKAPQDVILRMVLSGMHSRTGDSDKSASEIQRVARIRPDLWNAQFRLGRSLLQARDYEGAADALTKAVEAAPDKAMVYLALGSALVGLQDDEAALFAFGEAHRLNNRLSRARIEAALCKARLGDFTEASADLNELSRDQRNSSVLQHAMGELQFLLENYEEAVDFYRASIINADQTVLPRPAELEDLMAAEIENPKEFAEKIRAPLAEYRESLDIALREKQKPIRQRLARRNGTRNNT